MRSGILKANLGHFLKSLLPVNENSSSIAAKNSKQLIGMIKCNANFAILNLVNLDVTDKNKGSFIASQTAVNSPAISHYY